MPAPALARLSKALVSVTSRPALRAALADQGMLVKATGPEALAQLLRADTERCGAIARAIGARLD